MTNKFACPIVQRLIQATDLSISVKFLLVPMKKSFNTKLIQDPSGAFVMIRFLEKIEEVLKSPDSTELELAKYMVDQFEKIIFSIVCFKNRCTVDHCRLILYSDLFLISSLVAPGCNYRKTTFYDQNGHF